MEKYTFDIDKVLDDFEETEALKINNSHKSTEASLLQPIVNNSEEKLKVNEDESIFESSSSVDESTINLCDTNSVCPDKDVLQIALPDFNKCLELCDNSEVKSNLNENEQENKQVSNIHKPDVIDCTSSVHSTPLLENDIRKIDDKHGDSGSSEVILFDSSSKHNRVTKSISLTDTQSVNKGSFRFSVAKDGNLLPISGESAFENVKVIKFSCNNRVNAFTHDEKRVGNSQESASNDISVIDLSKQLASNCDDQRNVIKIKMVLGMGGNKHESYMNDNLNEHKCANGLNEVDISKSVHSGAHSLESEASTSNLKYLHIFQLDHSYCASNSTSEESKKSADQSVTSEVLPVEGGDDQVEDRDEQIENKNNQVDARNVQAVDRNNQVDDRNVQAVDRNNQVDDRNVQAADRNGVEARNNENENGEHEPRFVRHHPHFEFEDISDDDSGVSSDEAGNSPLFFFNNRMFNYNDGARVDVRNQQVAESQNVVYSACDNLATAENSASSELNAAAVSSSTSADNNETDSDQSVVGDSFQSGNAVTNQSDKFTGARPKVESMIHVLAFPVGTVERINAECEDQISEIGNEFNVLRNEKSQQDCDNSGRSDTMLIYSSDTSTLPDLHEIKNEETKCDSGEPGHSDEEFHHTSIETKHSNDITKHSSEEANIVSEETKISCEESEVPSEETKYFNKTSGNTELVSVNSEIENATVATDSQSDTLPQRLPRPTTLDLPSRHIILSQASSENGSISSESSNLPLSGANFVSNENETPIDDDTTEPMPSVRQQPQIGLVKPFWIPDAEAPNCMHCGVKFTVIKRRHHCRACGKVLCSRCCNLRAKLAYLNKEDRICHPCFEILSSTSQNENVPAPVVDSQSSSSCGSSPNFSPSPQIPNANFGDKTSWRPHPNNPDDYCSTIPPLQQIQLSGTRPPPTVMVPIGVLKRGNKPRREPKQVIFSDGIRPGGDLTDLTEPVDAIPVYRRMGRKRVEKAISDAAGTSIPFTSSSRCRQKRVLVSDEEGPLPPVVLQLDNDKTSEEKMDWNQLLERIQDDDQKPVSFALLKNMHLYVKLTKLDCCFGKECWCFTSQGLCAVGQDEIMVILERLPGESTLPRGILKLYTHIYDSASKGSTFDDLGHIIFPEQILGSSDHRGFLFVRPTFQCLSKLVVQNTPFLVAILIHKWEVPWAKVFPLRLMLRLGAECRYYPCALVSVRHRKPVFFEIGQTIMSVLADLRNYQFTIPVIPGLVVHMEEKKTCVNIPRNRYEKVMKVLNSNNVEHVLALGSNFSSEADSHLVCMQKEEGDYQTQAINIENTTRRVTGASFIVFSGALKSSSGLSAKFSIVEDGLLVQIPQETMVNLHVALRDMKDLTIECGQINAAEPEEVVIVQWTRDDRKFNIGVRSPIDGKSLEGIPNVRIHISTDYAGENYLIRWTEVFFLEVDDSSSSIQHELVDPCRLAETVAQSCCMALAPYLDQLAESELTKIGLRVTLDSEKDRVEYDIGARGKPLPATYMNALDCGLIPVILRLSGSAQSEPISFELIFHILIK